MALREKCVVFISVHLKIVCLKNLVSNPNNTVILRTISFENVLLPSKRCYLRTLFINEIANVLHMTERSEPFTLALEELRLKLYPMQTQRVQKALQQIHHDKYQLFENKIRQIKNQTALMKNELRTNQKKGTPVTAAKIPKPTNIPSALSGAGYTMAAYTVF